MNAIKHYVLTARLILESDHYDSSACKQITCSFPNLEQSLTCTVCRNLLNDPYSPTETSCQHHVCKVCVGGRKKLRPSCSWCKDYSKYVKNSQLQRLLVCYKGLCEYVRCTNLLTQLTDNENYKHIQSIVQKGIDLPYGKDVKHIPESKPNPETNKVPNCIDVSQSSEQNKQPSNVTFDASLSPANSEVNDSSFLEVDRAKGEAHLTDSVPKIDSPALSPVSVKKDQLAIKFKGITNDVLNSNTGRGNSSCSDSVTESLDSKPLYSVSFVDNQHKLILKRRTSISRRETRRDRGYVSEPPNTIESFTESHSLNTPEYSSQDASTNESRFRRNKPKPIVNSDRPNCRCGNATPKPGKLTCCGQRCACYMQSKACTGCRCRGCRNPHMFDGVKVLGRFMKDDPPDSDLMMSNNSSTFQELSTNFLNQQISYILPADLSGGTVLNIS